MVCRCIHDVHVWCMGTCTNVHVWCMSVYMSGAWVYTCLVHGYACRSVCTHVSAAFTMFPIC